MKKTPIVILHGWGLRGEIYKDLIDLLKKRGHKVFSFDLPGFGAEPLVNKTMMLDDYVVFVRKFIEKRKLIRPIMIGHSFGGRVAIKYAWKYKDEVSKLILTGVPVIRHISLTKKAAFLAAVIGGRVLYVFPEKTKVIFRKIFYRIIGEWDYYKAGPLKQVFKNVIGEDLIQYSKDIKTPTILVWGRKDQITPVFDVEKIKRFMPYAKSSILEGEGHKLPYTNPRAFFDAIKFEL